MSSSSRIEISLSEISASEEYPLVSAQKMFDTAHLPWLFSFNIDFERLRNSMRAGAIHRPARPERPSDACLSSHIEPCLLHTARSRWFRRLSDGWRFRYSPKVRVLRLLFQAIRKFAVPPMWRRPSLSPAGPAQTHRLRVVPLHLWPGSNPSGSARPYRAHDRPPRDQIDR